MSYDESLVSVTLEAAADLSAQQYRFVELTADHTVNVVNAVTDKPVGVLQNTPAAAGRAATVAILGVSRVEAGAALTAGPVEVTAAGKVIASAGTNPVVGYALRGAAASGDIVPVLLRLK